MLCSENMAEEILDILLTADVKEELFPVSFHRIIEVSFFYINKHIINKLPSLDFVILYELNFLEPQIFFYFNFIKENF